VTNAEYKARSRENNPIRTKYQYQKDAAAKRGIEWQFTLESWIAFWGEFIHLRGNGSGLMMCRLNDIGPYSSDNCYIGNMSTNRNDMQRRKDEQHRNEV